MDAAQNMGLFRELLQCGGNIYTWCYDAGGNLLESNCPDEAILSTAFSILGCHEKMMAHWRNQSNPITLGSGLSLVWGAAFEVSSEQMPRAWVIGPVFYTDVSMKSIREGFDTYIGVEVGMAWKHHFIDVLYRVPAVPHIVFSRDLLMLHYCLTGEYLMVSNIGIQALPESSSSLRHAGHKDRHKIWFAEQALLQMVKNGDLDYQRALNVSQTLSNGVPVQSSDPLRQGKISNTVFCSIVCRAAIEGGLSPEEAYTLGDAYIQSSESARTMDELTAIALTMYDDFIHRVHKCRTNPKLSPMVQKCVDYIEMHLEERIHAADLAAVAGYSEYYTTQRFRRETGLSVNDYIKFAKVERAKILLRGTDQDVREIASALGFSSRSHFSQSFKQVTGQSPAEFRAQFTGQ